MTPPEHARDTGTRLGIAYAMSVSLNGADWESRDNTREYYTHALAEALACRAAERPTSPRKAR